MTTGKHTAGLTDAGKLLLSQYIENERAGRLRPLITLGGADAGKGMPIPRWCGASASTAKKLARDGYVKHHRRAHVIQITDAGRAAISKATGEAHEI